jgi:hypothetical protein
MNGSRIAWPPPLISRLLRLIPAPTSYSEVLTGWPSSDRGLGRRPAHVERDHVGDARLAREEAQATTPAAGPDSTRCAGFRIADSALIRPPLDCMI